MCIRLLYLHTMQRSVDNLLDYVDGVADFQSIDYELRQSFWKLMYSYFLR